MKHSALHINNYYLTAFAYIALIVCLFCSTANGSSQGKLGKQSSATIDISVTVNQSLRTITSNELTLNKDNPQQKSSKPFCIAHKGFRKNAGVPYEITVNSITSSNTDSQNLPYKLYIEDKNKNKLNLHNGETITKQSTLSLSEGIVDECANHGMKLSMERNSVIKNNDSNIPTVGLMILLVSPY